MTVDLAGDLALPSTDPRVRYSAPQHGKVGYRVAPPGRRPLRIRRVGGAIRVEDSASGLAGEGASYLEAIQALGRAVRDRHGS